MPEHTRVPASFTIGNVKIAPATVLAPMAGVSVQAFRRQGRRFGAGLVCSEMVSACGLSYGNARTLGYLRIARDEHPRPDTSAESLAKLTPVFRPGGTDPRPAFPRRVDDV